MIYLPDERGQGLAEYGLILVLIAVVVFVVLGLLGTQLSTTYSRITSMIPEA